VLEFRKAKLSDIEAMQALVKSEIENGVILPRSNDEIATSIRSYTVVFFEGELAAYSALHIHTPILAEVRSLVVGEKLRGKGIGTKLVKKLLEEAEFYGIKKVFTLTYRKSFFEKIGFREIPKSELPEQKIWADCIKCKHFPICNEIALLYDI